MAQANFEQTELDLSIYRALYSLYMLTAVTPIAMWVSHLPGSCFYPPLGLAAVGTSLPDTKIITMMNGVLVVFLSMLLVGYRSRLASFGTAGCLVILNSWAYSFGKINHDILLIIVPLVFGCYGWNPGNRIGPHSSISGSPLTMLAVLIGYSMFTAGLDKAVTGWLDPNLLCTYGHLATNYFLTGRHPWLATQMLSVESVWLWKAFDIGVVVLEILLLCAALHRKFFLITLSITTIFHLGVLLIFDIPFSPNVIAYGAFVRFGQFGWLSTALKWIQTPMAFVVSVGIGFWSIWRADSLATRIGLPVADISVGIGAIIGISYLILNMRDWIRPRRVANSA